MFSFSLGVILIAVSSSAISNSYYIIAGIASLLWLFSRITKSRETQATLLLLASAIAVLLAEAQYHFLPSVDHTSDRNLVVIGDSVSAGVGGKSEKQTWPKIIATKHHLNVLDISHVGETAGSAFDRVKQYALPPSLIIIEIGGNDLLGSTTAQQFRKDLDRLLSHVTNPSRQVLMFELPLPPFRHEYGRIQRQLSREYGVLLIPKRIFLNVISKSGATLDTIHLTQEGHHRMADSVWSLIKTAYVN